MAATRFILTACVVFSLACDKKAPNSPSTSNASQRSGAGTSQRSPKPALPVPVALTIDQVKAAKDGQVEQLIFDAELKAIGDDYDWETEIVNAWPAGLRMLYATWIVEAEVNNGGFNQYFRNTNAKTAQAAIDGFNLIGAKQHAELMADAMQIRDAERAEMQKYKREGSMESFSESYKSTKLNELDDKFYALTENLSKHRVAYIRAHPEMFVTKQ